MTATEVNSRLAVVEPGSAGSAALARDLAKEARYPARLAIERYLPATNRAEVLKGMGVLERMSELTLVPLAESSPLSDADNEVWALQAMRDEFLAMRRRCAVVLAGLLSDKRPLPPPSPGYERELPPRLRVCDLAFILLNRMAHREAPMGPVAEQPRRQRDAHIIEFQGSRSLQRLTEK